jgi:hypothetical protein
VREARMVRAHFQLPVDEGPAIVFFTSPDEPAAGCGYGDWIGAALS